MVMNIADLKPLDSNDALANNNENGDILKKSDLRDSCRMVLLQVWENIYHKCSLFLLYQGLRVFQEATSSDIQDLYSWSPML